MSKKPVVLMVLDGYGLNDKTEGNAIAQAKTPVMDKLMKECPFQKGNASGLSVGLPDGQMAFLSGEVSRTDAPQLYLVETRFVVRSQPKP